MKTDAEKIDSLNLIDKHIKSLKGIEAFTNLIYLDCSWNEIDSLDLSKNAKLQNLDCSGTYAAHSYPTQIILNVKNFIRLPKNLIRFNAHLTSFSSFNSNELKQIESIKLSGGNYSNLDLSKCTLLKEFDFYPTTITTVCVNDMNKISELWTQSNKIIYQVCK